MARWLGLLASALLLASLPASTNYSLNSYGFGSGGTASSSSTNYGLNATAGDLANSGASSTNYAVGAGEKFGKQADVPLVTLSNPARLTKKLLLTIDPQTNPSDATFAVAISDDNFVTTNYVKADHTIGSALTTADYATYSGWGGSSGVYVIGLRASTTYYVKAKAYRGQYTESPYGPVSSATSTSDPLLTFEIDVSPTDTSTNPPYQVDFGDLLAATVTSAPTKIWATFDTNADNGGLVYVTSQNGGLLSTSQGYTISSVSGNLSSASQGFGAQVSSVTQASDGPLTAVSPYNGSGNVVGLTDTQTRPIFSSAGPVTSGRGSILLKAKAAGTTPASADYGEVLTMIAAASF